MKIFYQGEKGAYSNLASIQARNGLNVSLEDIVGKPNFQSVWEEIQKNNIGVLPVENSTAGSIHENLYNFLRHDFKIIGEISLEIKHFLLSNETDISKIKKAFSHPQALSQCYNFLKANNIEAVTKGDTAGSAKEISENKIYGVGAIASSLAGEIYGLNVVKDNIQDQDGNTTRFFIVVKKDSEIDFKEKKGKTSIIFEARNIPASLYKCLGAFATNNINLTKIESMPSFKDPFTYMFWVDFEGDLAQDSVKNALHELEFFTNEIKILGEY